MGELGELVRGLGFCGESWVLGCFVLGRFSFYYGIWGKWRLVFVIFLVGFCDVVLGYDVVIIIIIIFCVLFTC